jgi:hypothetical protein
MVNNSAAIALSTAKGIAVLRFNQQDNGDLVFDEI